MSTISTTRERIAPRSQHMRSDPSVHTLDSEVQTVNTTFTPQQYAEAVAFHSRQTADRSGFPGPNFENLAIYLRRTFEPKAHRLQSQPRVPPSSTDAFPFLTAYIHGENGEWNSRTEHDDPTALPYSNKPMILFLRGKPSSKWLSSIGAAYKIDPEFFNRHLDFRATLGRIDYLSQPTLPSARSVIFELPVMTVGQVKNPHRHASQSTIDAMRLDADNRLTQYQRLINSWFDMDYGIGESLVRDFTLHDHTHFAIEQRISIALCKNFETWQLFVWLDGGKSLSQSPREAPWHGLSDPEQPAKRRQVSIYPAIRTYPSIALRSHRYTITPESKTYDDLAHNSSHLHVGYGAHLDSSTMAVDPFYALYDIIHLVAVSYKQYLNMLEQKNTQRTKLSLASSDDPSDPSNQTSESWNSTNLRYDQAVLGRHLPQLKAILQMLRQHVRPSLPSATSSSIPLPPVPQQYAWPHSKDPIHELRAAQATHALLCDFEDLISQAERLLGLYTDGMALLMNRAVMAEAAKSVAQAIEVTKLTRLAFVYIPLSFTATFFGMNVRELDNWMGRNTAVPMWLWVAVSVPVVAISFAFMFWDLRDLWKGAKALLSGRTQREDTHSGTHSPLPTSKDMLMPDD